MPADDLPPGVLGELAARQQRHLFPAPGPRLRERAREVIGVLDLTAVDVRSERTWHEGDLAVEELSWDVGFGPRTHAYLLRPLKAGHHAVLPGVMALHCHGGVKHVGKEKLAGPATPAIASLREQLYGGRAWAEELARRGFAVLVPDALGWGSRRIPLAEMAADGVEGDFEGAEGYDALAGRHEHVLAKHLSLLGTSYAGVVAGEDLAAAAYLRSRPDVGPVACAGLSGGGLRAALLGAFDPGIAAVASIAMISSYRDLLAGYVHRHTWMLYPPGLSQLCDLPDLVASGAPRPLLVWYGERDEILPANGMRRAHTMITAHYRRHPDRYTGIFADAGHSFGTAAQERVFGWLTRQLTALGGTAWR